MKTLLIVLLLCLGFCTWLNAQQQAPYHYPTPTPSPLSPQVMSLVQGYQELTDTARPVRDLCPQCYKGWVYDSTFRIGAHISASYNVSFATKFISE